MSLLFIDKMNERLAKARQDSDTDVFITLTYMGELITKATAAIMTAGVVNGKERYQYKIEHDLVRENGIGAWANMLDSILLGPYSSHLITELRPFAKEITQKCKPGTWQNDSVTSLVHAIDVVEPGFPQPTGKLNLLQWFHYFAKLRNASKGHGAPLTDHLSSACLYLQSSIDSFINNFGLFENIQMAFLKQNLSGRYRVSKTSINTENFDHLKTTGAEKKSYKEGLYIYLDKPRIANLIISDADQTDHYFPNGNFNKSKFEALSYSSGSKQFIDSSCYQNPTDILPKSETRAAPDLDVIGSTFSNIPSKPLDYINRNTIESEIIELIYDERNPVITLIGAGGVGKTSTALECLHKACSSDIFSLVTWFSSRDIDLLPEGPKLVRPDILTIDDIANEFVRLVDPDEQNIDGFDAKEFLQDCLMHPYLDKPTIFVFDNFETLREPIESFKWLNSSIRLPNKIIITTRFRDFKGDYPIEVRGLSNSQAQSLVEATASRLHIETLLSQKDIDDIIDYSSGHPYVIKIILGDIKRNNSTNFTNHAISSKEDLLNALFDRTYFNLSAGAKRIYLTLCAWKSYVPEIAIEAVVAKSEAGKIDIPTVIEELLNSSMIDRYESNESSYYYLSVPLTSYTFGKNKLKSSPYKMAIESDMPILHLLGAAQHSDLIHGIHGKMERLINGILNRVKSDKQELDTYLEMLDYISIKYPKASLLIADILVKLDLDFELAKKYIYRFIEESQEQADVMLAWDKLANLCKDRDLDCEIQALYELTSHADTDYDVLSDTANRINVILRDHNIDKRNDQTEHFILNVAQKMDRQISKANGTDCSRLAWLYLHLNEEDKAIEICRHGLSIDPDNQYCQSLISKLKKKM